MQELQRLSAICLCDIVCILSSVSPAPERRVVLFDFDFRCHWATWTSALYHRTKKCVRKLGNERAGRASLFIIYIGEDYWEFNHNGSFPGMTLKWETQKSDDDMYIFRWDVITYDQHI